ncbi:hypothetical protein L208DRAFT_805682 [Tricholoma matsutake]|nr:hypothetical protein L208DRAFT_805682 [Tricholoma matsutake 945]
MLGNNSHCSLEHLHKSVSLPVSSSYLVPTCITTYTVDHNGRTIQRNIVLQPLFGRSGNNIINSNSWTFRSLNCARRSLEGCCHVLTPLMVFLCLEGLVIRVSTMCLTTMFTHPTSRACQDIFDQCHENDLENDFTVLLCVVKQSLRRLRDS